MDEIAYVTLSTVGSSQKYKWRTSFYPGILVFAEEIPASEMPRLNAQDCFRHATKEEIEAAYSTYGGSWQKVAEQSPQRIDLEKSINARIKSARAKSSEMAALLCKLLEEWQTAEGVACSQKIASSGIPLDDGDPKTIERLTLYHYAIAKSAALSETIREAIDNIGEDLMIESEQIGFETRPMMLFRDYSRREFDQHSLMMVTGAFYATQEWAKILRIKMLAKEKAHRKNWFTAAIGPIFGESWKGIVRAIMTLIVGAAASSLLFKDVREAIAIWCHGLTK